MIDWVKWNSIIVNWDYYKENPDKLQTTIIECWPDNMLKNILRKSRERGLTELIPHLEKEMNKRGLKITK